MRQTPPKEPVATIPEATAEPAATAVVTSEPGGNIEADVRLTYSDFSVRLVTNFNKPNAEDNFSDLGDDFSDTVSLSSSVLNYTYENGRRYHAYRAGQYVSSSTQNAYNELTANSYCQMMKRSRNVWTSLITCLA